MSRIKKDASLNVCANCGNTSHDVKHLFAFPAHPTTLIPSDIWSKPVESILEFSYHIMAVNVYCCQSIDYTNIHSTSKEYKSEISKSLILRMLWKLSIFQSR